MSVCSWRAARSGDSDLGLPLRGPAARAAGLRACLLEAAACSMDPGWTPSERYLCIMRSRFVVKSERALRRPATVVPAVVVALAIGGCATSVRRETTPAPDDRPPDVQPACEVLSGTTGSAWYEGDLGDEWTDRGSLFYVCRSESIGEPAGAPGGGGFRSVDGARTAALETAYGRAFEHMGARGVSYDEPQLETMIRDKARLRAAGGDVAFPRVEVYDSVDEVCPSASDSLRTYRSSLLAEYPIASLRGDVNNARWHARRAAAEASVLAGSAEAFLEEGRWFDGLLELAGAAAVLEGAARLPDVMAAESRVRSMTATAVRSLSVEPLDGVAVLEVAERTRHEVRFRWTYDWGGRSLPAWGVPVSFEPIGFEAILESDAATGRDGVAACRVLLALGEPGECYIRQLPNGQVLSAALGDTWTPAPGADEDGGSLSRVFLTRGVHALTVCVEVDGLSAEDEAQFITGFERRAEKDGFALLSCGPDVDLVVRAAASKAPALQGEDDHSAEVSLSAVVFDQRVASELGRPSIRVGESGADARGSEVLALKEAGRLLAAYVRGRALLSVE